MPFWQRETPEERRLRKRQEASVSALEGGRLPLAARHRLERQKRRDDGFFTSSLSINESLVANEAGYDCLGLVMGSCFQQLSYASLGRFYRPLTGEMEAMTHAQTLARVRCIQRLALEAKVLGAHGVVGVKIKTRAHPWASGLVEFTAVGTAIRVPEMPPRKEPFTSHLSGQDFWQLHRAGYWPRALVFGLSCYYVNQNPDTQALVKPMPLIRLFQGNQEVVQYTQGFYLASRSARANLSREVQRLRARGAVGMEVQYHLDKIDHEVNRTVYQDLLITLVALGTAVDQLDTPSPDSRRTLMVLDLASGETHAL